MGIVGTIIIGAIAGAGIAGASGGFGGAPKPPGAPALPNQQKADANAQDTVNSQRRLSLLTGGQTDFTGGTANVTSNDINKQLLLGG